MRKKEWRGMVRSVLRQAMRFSILRQSLRRLTSVGLIPSYLWKRLPVEGVFSVSLVDGKSFLYYATPNDGIARSLYWRGIESWESETIPVFYTLAQNASLVLDIGANTGVYTLLACTANPTTKVISFEPVPSVYDKLVENVCVNSRTYCVVLK